MPILRELRPREDGLALYHFNAIKHGIIGITCGVGEVPSQIELSCYFQSIFGLGRIGTFGQYVYPVGGPRTFGLRTRIREIGQGQQF